MDTDKMQFEWGRVLWGAMAATGHGYRYFSQRNTGVRKDRRADKRMGETKTQRRARQRTLTHRWPKAGE